MDIETYRNYCMSKKTGHGRISFPSLPNILVFKVGGKMFSATDVSTFGSISVKCSPDEIDELRSTYPAFTDHTYFSNRHWGNILMDNSIPDNKFSNG